VSSPNARRSYSAWDRARIWLHRRASHRHRIALLAEVLGHHVAPGGTLLDLGCGDLRLAAALAAERHLTRCVGADVWPQREAPPPGTEYRSIDPDRALPWADGEFETVLLVDALHHADDHERLFREALRVGRQVLVKDHLEYGLVSHGLLRLLDYLGNDPYGVSVPGRYLRPGEFEALASRLAPGRPTHVRVGVDIYARGPLLLRLLPARLHFVAVVGSWKGAPAVTSAPTGGSPAAGQGPP